MFSVTLSLPQTNDGACRDCKTSSTPRASSELKGKPRLQRAREHLPPYRRRSWVGRISPNGRCPETGGANGSERACGSLICPRRAGDRNLGLLRLSPGPPRDPWMSIDCDRSCATEFIASSNQAQDTTLQSENNDGNKLGRPKGDGLRRARASVTVSPPPPAWGPSPLLPTLPARPPDQKLQKRCIEVQDKKTLPDGESNPGLLRDSVLNDDKQKS